jgi:5'-nucleotidase
VLNSSKFASKLSKFLRDGPANLEVVSDFDQTLTRYSFNDKLYSSTHGAMQSVLSAEQTKMCNELYEHYHPLETDSSIPYKEKFALMEAWNGSVSRVMLQVPFPKSELSKVLLNDKLLLRYGVEGFLSVCKAQDIPFTVVSAGLGNLIELCLGHVAGGSRAQVHANFIEFDAEGMSSHFREPFLHSLSKPSVLASRLLRKNVLLLGDMPHDLLMVGHHSPDSVISIGYFNDASRYNLADYEQHFDVLCLCDGNLEIAELMVAWVSGVSRSVDYSPSLQSLLPYKAALA